MRLKYLFIIFALLVAIYMAGCGKKEANLTETQETMLTQEPTQASSETTAEVATKAKPVEVSATSTPEPTPSTPTQISQPTAKEIQTALKNAGFYTGSIDGDIGPLTKKAIEEFQKANNLNVDGKVGPKTWGVLSKYLNSPAQTETNSEITD